MSNDKRTNQFLILLSDKEKENIRRAAIKADRSMGSFVRMVLHEYFKKEK